MAKFAQNQKQSWFFISKTRLQYGEENEQYKTSIQGMIIAIKVNTEINWGQQLFL
jgi:hypothetical protein